MHMKRIVRIVFATGLILLIPLVAMQFSTEVNWGPEDFIATGTLLFIVGTIYEFAIRRIANTRRRLIVTIALGLAFLYVWVELAVGIFNIPGISGS